MQSLKMENGDLVFQGDDLLIIEDKEEVVQCCRHEIATNTGEWFLNPEMGINFDLFVGKHVNEDLMRAELQQALLRDQRILSVDSISFNVNRQARTMLITFKASGPNGEVYQGEVENPA